MASFFELFSEQSFMPHGHCYLWTPSMVWLQVVTNALIGAAYVFISFTLVNFIRRVDDLPFRLVYVAFGTFIIACGITHFIDIWVIWEPRYWLDGGLRAITATASVGTALLLPRYIPRAVELAQHTRRMQREGVELEAALQDLGTMYQRTRELDRLKTDFFANVSHELRTPLTLILAPLEAALRHVELDPEVRSELGVAQRNARVLLAHVTDLLDIQKLDEGKLLPAYAATDLSALVREAAAAFEPLAREREITLRVGVPSEIPAQVDGEQIRRVLLNLLSNAFKFTPRKGVIEALLETEPRDGERTHAVLRVKDSGPGVSAADRERIFERYGQGSGDVQRAAGGTGLGLAIVRELVQLHGGSVELAPPDRSGASFVVRIPLRAPAQARVAEPMALAPLAPRAVEGGPPSAPAAPAEDAPLVLIAEDNPDMRRLVVSVVSTRYRTLEASDGAEALALTQAHKPDLIISDLTMPVMSGEELVYALRADSTLDGLPVLLLTAKADGALRARVLQSGAQDYLLKPFEREELLARVGNLVTMRRTQLLVQQEVEAKQLDVEQLTRQLLKQKRALEEALVVTSAAREEAERASRQKSDFLSLVSHELRTPLASIRLQLERLRRGLAGALEPAQGDVVNKIGNASNRLLALVDSLLQFGRVEAGRIEPAHSELDVLAIAREIVDDLKLRAEGRALEIRVEAADHCAPLVSDPELVRLILANLCDNALKYTPEGEILVTVERAARGAVRVCVRDTGLGIAEHARERIFEPFEQLEQVRHKKRSGVGLGLALVKRVAALLHAELALESEEGRGSAFSVTFPTRVLGDAQRV